MHVGAVVVITINWVRSDSLSIISAKRMGNSSKAASTSSGRQTVTDCKPNSADQTDRSQGALTARKNVNIFNMFAGRRGAVQSIKSALYQL